MAGSSPWWGFFEKFGGAVLVVGGIVTTIAAAAHPADRPWLYGGIAAIVVGVLVLVVGLAGQLKASLGHRETPAIPPDPARSPRRETHSVERDDGMTITDITERHREVDAPLAASLMASGVLTALHVSPADWTTRCGDPSDWQMSFVLEHRTNNIGAIHSFSSFRCEVTLPDKSVVTLDGRGMRHMIVAVLFTHPRRIPDGVYQWMWVGDDAQGNPWELKSGRANVLVPRGIPQHQNGSEGAPHGIDIRILDDELHRSHQRLADFIAAKVEVSSTRNTRISLAGTETFPYAGGFVPDPAWNDGIDVVRERDRIEQSHDPLPHTVEPGRPIVGWAVVMFPHRANGGEPSYVITIKDAFGHRYSVTREAVPE